MEQPVFRLNDVQSKTRRNFYKAMQSEVPSCQDPKMSFLLINGRYRYFAVK